MNNDNFQFLYNTSMEDTPLKVTECGKEQCMPTKPVPGFIEREYYTLHYVIHGKGFINIKNKDIEVNPGDVFVRPKDGQLVYYPSKSKPWTYIWAGIQGKIADTFMNMIDFNHTSPVLHLGKDSTLTDYFENLLTANAQPSFMGIKTTAYAMLILSRIIETRFSVSALHLSQKRKHVQEAQMFISCNYATKLSVKSIAASLNLNPNYLCNIFNEVLGMSTKQYLTKYRINKACALLTDSNKKIHEIAGIVGYSDSLHFSKEFSRITGVTPMNYRKTHRNKTTKIQYTDLANI